MMSLTIGDLKSISAIVEHELSKYADTQAALCGAHWEKTSDHHKTLYGNGQPGLKSEVTRLKVIASIAAFASGATFVALVGLIVQKFLK